VTIKKYHKHMDAIGICIKLTILMALFIPSEQNHVRADDIKPWYYEISTDWGGHIRAQASVSRPGDKTVYELVGVRTYYDGTGDFRLKNRIFFGSLGYVEAHYEAVISGGDTRRKETALENRYAYLAEYLLFLRRTVNDDRRLMDLTSVLDETDEYIFYHRLDRLLLALQFERGMVRVGRQALTWGNGLLFNPMDLFNPFSPTDCP